MRSILLTFLILLTSVVSFGQKGKVEGKITDAKTNQPLTGVSVLNKATGKGAASDVEGRYTLTIEGASKISLVFSYNGVTQQVDDIEIKEAQITTQDIALTQREKTEDRKSVV